MHCTLEYPPALLETRFRSSCRDNSGSGSNAKKLDRFLIIFQRSVRLPCVAALLQQRTTGNKLRAMLPQPSMQQAAHSRSAGAVRSSVRLRHVACNAHRESCNAKLLEPCALCVGLREGIC